MYVLLPEVIDIVDSPYPHPTTLFGLILSDEGEVRMASCVQRG